MINDAELQFGRKNDAELATMLPAETKKAGYLAEACFTNQGYRHAALLFRALGRWQFAT